LAEETMGCRKVATGLIIFLMALFFAIAILVFMSNPSYPLALLAVMAFLFLILAGVPSLFIAAWIKNENNIREKIKEGRTGSSTNLRQLASTLEMMIHILLK
jgi:hypothetical protein